MLAIFLLLMYNTIHTSNGNSSPRSTMASFISLFFQGNGPQKNIKLSVTRFVETSPD